MHYFAYGSNMDKSDLDDWCKKHNKRIIKFNDIVSAKLNDYRLTFNHYSNTRGGGAANIMPLKGSYVYGLLIKIDKKDLEIIRSKEGYPQYYGEVDIEVESFDGTIIKNVKSYKVVKKKEKTSYQAPTKDYLKIIIRNAKKYNFPPEYIDFLKSLKVK